MLTRHISRRARAPDLLPQGAPSNEVTVAVHGCRTGGAGTGPSPQVLVDDLRPVAALPRFLSEPKPGELLGEGLGAVRRDVSSPSVRVTARARTHLIGGKSNHISKKSWVSFAVLPSCSYKALMVPKWVWKRSAGDTGSGGMVASCGGPSARV